MKRESSRNIVRQPDAHIARKHGFGIGSREQAQDERAIFLALLHRVNGQ